MGEQYIIELKIWHSQRYNESGEQQICKYLNRFDLQTGFMVLEPQVFDYLDGDDCVFEKTPLQKLAEEGELMSYKHKGFWQCMDTKREKDILEKMWSTGNAPWKVWKD